MFIFNVSIFYFIDFIFMAYSNSNSRYICDVYFLILCVPVPLSTIDFMSSHPFLTFIFTDLEVTQHPVLIY